MMSCRTGPLRVGRPLRGVYTGRGKSLITVRPMAGVSVEQRETLCCTHRQDNLRRRANARPPRRRPVRQDIRYSAEGGVFGLGSSGSAGDQKDAGWSAEPVDAGSGWEAVGGEVSK
jgi:hypothetical protein